MEMLKLNNGIKMPNFGLGTYLIEPKGYKQLEKAYKDGKIKSA